MVELLVLPIVEPVVEPIVVLPLAQLHPEPMVLVINQDNTCALNRSSLVKNLDISTGGVSVESDSLADMPSLEDVTPNFTSYFSSKVDLFKKLTLSSISSFEPVLELPQSTMINISHFK